MALKCELCGGTEFVKEDGMFVCSGCNTKYSVEEAKKLLGNSAEDTDTIAGMSQKLENLYELARRAKDEGNSENAEKYYEMIMVENPMDWEASFYSVYYKAMGCKIAEIESAGLLVKNSLSNVFALINKLEEKEDRIEAASEVAIKVIAIDDLFINAAKNHYNGIDYSIKNNYTQQYIDNVFAAFKGLYTLGDLIEENFDFEDSCFALASLAWDSGADHHMNIASKLQDAAGNRKNAQKYKDKVAKYKRMQDDKEREEAQKRNEAYWAEHAEEKKELEDRGAQLQKQIDALDIEKCEKIGALKKEINAVIKSEVVKKIEDEIREKEQTLSGIGFFNFKDKKACKAEIDELRNKLNTEKTKQSKEKNNINGKISDTEKEYDSKIQKLKSEIADINNELTRNR